MIANGITLMAPPPAYPATTSSREYDLKAAFIFHFAEFIDWPASSLGAPGVPMTIGILGEDPFGGSLDQIVANETVKGRRFQVRRCKSPTQVDSCQIVFISPSEEERMTSIVNRISRPGLLTVGDTSDFAKQNGVIGFVQAGSRLRLRINLVAARAARLTISSKLLRQADVVRKEAASR
jgi:YfiR/HmsC-like